MFKTVKTSDLSGGALDWAVAKCENQSEHPLVYSRWRFDYVVNGEHYYSTDWAQGGPIIEREAITVSEGSPVIGLEWMACDRSSSHIQHGPSYLIAAMRCYVASKLGDEVEIPEELKGESK